MKSLMLVMRISLVAALAATMALFAAMLRTTSAPQKTSPVHPPALRQMAQSARPGALRANSGAPSQTSTSARPAPTASSLSVSELLEENRKLRAANEQLRTRLQALLNWILANFRGRFPLPESMFSRVQITPLTEDDVLNPELTELLRISPHEVERLNDAFGYAVAYLSEIESAILTVTEPRAGKIVLHIPTFQENGQLLKEDLYAAIEATLGTDRFVRFLKVTENGLMRRFYRFGEASRTVVFELTYDANESTPRILIKDGYIWEIEPGVREITARETIATNMPAKYAPYLAWLPEKFTAQIRAE